MAAAFILSEIDFLSSQLDARASEAGRIVNNIVKDQAKNDGRILSLRRELQRAGDQAAAGGVHPRRL
jgi:hypothetical protein